MTSAASTAGVVLTIRKNSANAGDLGAASATAGTGFDLAAGATVTLEVEGGDILYAIRSGASDATPAVVRT